MIITSKNETKKMYKKNLELLSPWIRETMSKIDEETLWSKIQITYNDDNYPICQYYDGDISFKVTGNQPLKEAEKWGKSIIKRGTGSIFLYGCGFGYSLFEIFAHKMSHTLVVVFEQDIYLFKAMLYYFDLEPIIKTQKIVFLIGESEDFADAFEKLFYSIVFINCTYPTLAFTYLSQRNFKAEYLKIHKYVFTQLGLLIFYMGNDHQDNLIGFQNLLSNTKEILQNPSIRCLKDKFKGFPAFIIANGPSLDRNIKQLKGIKDKGLIISTESAILPLIKNSINADILTVVERTKFTYMCHFKGIKYPEDLSLICLGLVDKHVLPSFEGAKVPVFRISEAINKWVNEYIGDGTGIDAGANVSHLALELAVYLGADPIIFVGQNYAYGTDGSTHSRDSVYFNEKGRKARENIEAMPIVYVEDNNGRTIPSNQLWVDFKNGLERKISAHKEKVFINVTEGGAKIQGTRYEKLEDIIKEYCVKNLPYRVNEIIAEHKAQISVSEKKENLIEFIKNIEKYAQLFRGLVRETIAGKLECKKMIRLSQGEDNVKQHKILEEAYQNNIKIYQRFIAEDMFRCFSQQIIFIYFYLMNRLGTIDTAEKITEIFKIQHNFFMHLNVVSQSVSVHLENAAELLNDILIAMGNKEEGK